MSDLVTIGRTVHYTLTEVDAALIASQRKAAGVTAYNVARAGDVYPAQVVRVFNPSVGTANLQVTLDGTDTYWATSRTEGEDAGYWAWPARS